MLKVSSRRVIVPSFVGNCKARSHQLFTALTSRVLALFRFSIDVNMALCHLRA